MVGSCLFHSGAQSSGAQELESIPH
jgi:hypothetical protein